MQTYTHTHTTSPPPTHTHTQIHHAYPQWQSCFCSLPPNTQQHTFAIDEPLSDDCFTRKVEHARLRAHVDFVRSPWAILVFFQTAGLGWTRQRQFFTTRSAFYSLPLLHPGPTLSMDQCLLQYRYILWRRYRQSLRHNENTPLRLSPPWLSMTSKKQLLRANNHFGLVE